MTLSDPTPAEPCWRVPGPPGAVQWRRWDDDVVVRVESSGDTHLLGREASLVFSAVLAAAQAGATVPSLAASLVGAAVAEAADVEAVQQLLTALSDIDLVERV